MTFKYNHLPHFLSLGAGVQSSTLALMYATGELTPMPGAAIFADTQAEPQSVYDWLDWLETQLPYPVHRVTAGDLGATVSKLKTKSNGDIYSESNIPFFALDDLGNKTAFVKRQCTSKFKIRPINKHLRKLAKVPRGQKEPCAVSVIGISTDELKRMKPARDPWLVHRWPLIERRQSRAMCSDWMAKNNFPKPPRSACSFCAFRSNAEWRELQKKEPEAFAFAVQTERELNAAKEQNANFHGFAYLHRSCKPLDSIDFRTDVERGQQTFWDDECEGMCGV